MVREEKNHHQAYEELNELVFFDRCIVDSYGYSQLENLPISQALIDACQRKRYANPVFIFPPWEAIFANDEERKQDFCEAIRTYQAMVAAYAQYGYELIEVPTMSIEQRVDFILERLKHRQLI
jgi:predicted ATPase